MWHGVGHLPSFETQLLSLFFRFFYIVYLMCGICCWFMDKLAFWTVQSCSGNLSEFLLLGGEGADTKGVFGHSGLIFLLYIVFGISGIEYSALYTRFKQQHGRIGDVDGVMGF